MNNNTKKYYNSKQGRLPLFISDRLDICDPVLAFDKIMEEIGIEKYLKPEPLHKMGRPGYNRVNMLKTILFGFMDTGYASLRELEDRCKVNIRYMYLMDHETPSYRAFSYFINEEIKGSAQDIFKAVMPYIQTAEGIDLQHLYIWLKIRGKRKQVYLGLEKSHGKIEIPSVRQDHHTAYRNERNAGIHRAENRNECGIHTGQPGDDFVQV